MDFANPREYWPDVERLVDLFGHRFREFPKTLLKVWFPHLKNINKENKIS